MGTLLACVFVCLVSKSFAITFNKCEVVNQLRRQGFPEYLMDDLVCMIGASSGYRTHVISGPGPDGAYSFGLFQINDRYWCSTGHFPGKACNVRCVDLILDDITLAANCAKIILRQHGLHAWSAWKKNCENYKIPPHNCVESMADFYKFN